jgi:hypothetical protein
MPCPMAHFGGPFSFVFTNGYTVAMRKNAEQNIEAFSSRANTPVAMPSELPQSPVSGMREMATGMRKKTTSATIEKDDADDTDREILDFVVDKVEFIETPKQAEARRERYERIAKKAKQLSEALQSELERRWYTGDTSFDYMDYERDLSDLLSDEILDEQPVGVGANATKKLEFMSGMVAFQKSAEGEERQLIDPATGDLLTEKTVFKTGEDDKSYRSTTYLRSKDLNKKKADIEHLYFASREQLARKHLEKYAEFYGFDIDDYPVDETAFGRRMLEHSASIRREFVSAMFDKLLGLNVVPATVLMTDGEELYSRQKGIKGAVGLGHPAAGLLTKDGVIRAIAEDRPHSAIESLMRLAVLHDGVGYSDGHTDNGLADKQKKHKPQRVWGIDFGFSLPLHYRAKNGDILSDDRIRSAPIQFIEKNKSLVLDDEARASLRTVLQETMDHLAYKKMMVKDIVESLQERKRLMALPEEVKNGSVARLIRELFVFAYEVEGKPEMTRQIALKEMGLFLRWLGKVVKTGRPRMPGTDMAPGLFARLPEVQDMILSQQKTAINDEVDNLL